MAPLRNVGRPLATPAAVTEPGAGLAARGLVWWQPSGVLAILLAWGAVHLALRVALSGVLTIDDSRELMFAQTLEWGYQPRQPPLYNWLVWIAVRLLGPTVLAVTLVKYVALGLAGWFVY